MKPDIAYAVAVQLLARHWCFRPLACDCEESIERWWLGADAGVTRAQLRSALAWLERIGAIESLRAADGRVRYRRRLDFDSQAMQHIAEDEPTEGDGAGHQRH
jgi:hypothetical protein